MRKLLAFILCVLLIGGAFVFREKITKVYAQMHAQFLPCTTEITYSLGQVDSRFGYSKAQFLDAIQEAERVWEGGADRPLFSYVEDGGSVTVNFIYDDRQEAVDKLKAIGISIDKNQSTYDSLRARYDSLQSSFDAQKASLESGITALQRDQVAYNAEVEKWNDRGGAPKDVYASLQSQKQSLLTRRAQLENMQTALNSQVETINALATTLNRLAHDLKIQASTYNTIGASTGGEFEEGVYISSLGEQSIEIYEFSNSAELVRVLAHELGHALGLEHIEDTDAIMYELNQSTNDTLTAADLKELERVCKIRS